ncbi:hypothetical protein ACFL4V_00230 [Candidatus Latescibacterota bacterium]
MIALVERLPQEITDSFSDMADPKSISYFTERKLRPLTLIKSDEEKIERFREMKGK